METAADLLMAAFTDLGAVRGLMDGLTAEISSGWKGGDADEYSRRFDILKQEIAAAADSINNLARAAAEAVPETAPAEGRL